MSGKKSERGNFSSAVFVFINSSRLSSVISSTKQECNNKANYDFVAVLLFFISCSHSLAPTLGNWKVQLASTTTTSKTREKYTEKLRKTLYMKRVCRRGLFSGTSGQVYFKRKVATISRTSVTYPRRRWRLFFSDNE